MKSTIELNEQLEAAVANGEFYVVEITTERCPTGQHKTKMQDGSWAQIAQYADGRKMLFANKSSADKHATTHANAKAVVYRGPISIGMGPFVS